MSLYNPEKIPPVAAQTVARIDRRLPFPGEVLVRVGQRVETEDIIARALVPATPRIVNIASDLAVPIAQTARLLRVKQGDAVRAGQVLARTPAALGRTSIAPVAGVLTAFDPRTGYATITPDPQEIRLQAAMWGFVMDVLPFRGVTLETPAAQVYGAFGVGLERSGVLRLMVTDPTEPITAEMIDERSTFAILIGGAGITAAGLRRAIEKQVRGIILGSMAEPELRQWFGATHPVASAGALLRNLTSGREHADLGLTLVLTEGFGTRPMSSAMFDLLSSHDRQEALIVGTTRIHRPLLRPRVIIPLRRSGITASVAADQPLHVGATVRLRDYAHLGQQGVIRAISTLPRRLPFGVQVMAVDVELPSGETLWFPRTAVELLAMASA